MYCNKCGNKLEENSNYCSKCGNKLLEHKNNNNIKKQTKKLKLSPTMIIVIIINVILIILNIYFNGSSIIENFVTKEYSISTSSYGEKATIRINERIIDKAIDKLNNIGLVVHENMYVIYENNKAQQYLVITEYSSQYSNMKGFNDTLGKFYSVKAIDIKTGNITDITTANKAYGTDYIISKALDSENIINGKLGEFKYGKDYTNTSSKQSNDTSSTTYVSNALFLMILIGILYFIYWKTKRKSAVIIAIGIICIIFQLMFIIPHISFKSTNNSNDTSYINTNIHGIFTDKDEAIASEGYGTSYNTYSFLRPGNVKYEEEGTTYEGRYSIRGNKISITYIEAYDPIEKIKLDKYKDELTIEDENTLITSDGVKFYKEQ